MEKKQFDALMDANKATSESVKALGTEQKRQGEVQKTQTETLNGFGLSMATVQEALSNVKERAKEDRENDKKDRKDATEKADKDKGVLEKKLKGAHERIDDAVALRGEFDNHVKDAHASKAIATDKAFTEHSKDNNRHGGQAPEGSNGSAIVTGAKWTGVGAALIAAVEVIRQIFS